MDSNNNGENEARELLLSITDRVEHLEHARDCKKAFCLETRGEVIDVAEYHNEWKAEDNIRMDALSVDVRSGWTPITEPLLPESFCILLSFGGPSVRIVGALEDGKPNRAQIEYRDWGEQWTRLTGLTDQELDSLVAFASVLFD